MKESRVRSSDDWQIKFAFDAGRAQLGAGANARLNRVTLPSLSLRRWSGVNARNRLTRGPGQRLATDFMSTRHLPIGITASRTEPWFRYQRGQHSKPVYFYYGTKITKAAARAAVIAHAERENKTWTPRIIAARKGRKTKSNRSGVVGVSIKTEKGRVRGSFYYYWWARWPGSPSGIKFSILEHTDRKAFCLAQNRAGARVAGQACDRTRVFGSTENGRTPKTFGAEKSESLTVPLARLLSRRCSVEHESFVIAPV